MREFVAMEATGPYWKSVWQVLEGSFELVLANARDVKNVLGRKSDVNDPVWLPDLLAHGLIRSSFVPPEPILELRDLTRTRKQLVRERGQHMQRNQKVLEDANIKLSSVVSDVPLPTDGHLISWAGLCPRMDESAGQHRSKRMRPGAQWLKTTLGRLSRRRAAR